MKIEAWERNYRSSCSQIFFKLVVLKNFANFTRKHLCWSLFNNVAQEETPRREEETPTQVPWERQDRSSRSQIFFKIGVLKNFANFTGKHLCWSLFWNFIKNRLQHRCFPVKFAKFLRTPFLQNTSGGYFWN